MAVSKRVRKGIPIFLLLFWTIVFSWMFYSMQARGFDQSVLKSDDRVEVLITNEWILFNPVRDSVAAGMIFYPGALVDPTAYVPMARKVAEQGYLISIVRIPYRMDLFDWQREKVITRTLTVISAEWSPNLWIIGGHSRGGKTASHLASVHPEWFNGLLLIGTSHPREDNLSHLPLDVVKIYGTEDGLASEEEVKHFAGNLPHHTRFVRIEGGNHRQFGYYGWQLGDGRAKIDRGTQIQLTIETILSQLKRIEQIKIQDISKKSY